MFSGQFLVWAGLAALIAHTVQSIVHTFIVYKHGADHSVKLDQVVSLLDGLAPKNPNPPGSETAGGGA